jgi:hypothetical protein
MRLMRDQLPTVPTAGLDTHTSDQRAAPIYEADARARRLCRLLGLAQQLGLHLRTGDRVPVPSAHPTAGKGVGDAR